MSKRLAGKTALVTAAGQGIGKATAELFAAEGANVLAADINEVGLAQLSGVRSKVLDVTDGAAVKALAEEVGAVDVLFNCAGFVHHGTILEVSDDDWSFSFDVNVRGMYLMIRNFLPAMLDGAGASIINMASVASSVRGLVDRCAYGASKAAVIGLTKSVAADYVGKGIRCNAICPGTVATPSLEERIAALPDPVKARTNFVARQPMGRLGTPEEIAELCVYLAADESAYMTGGVISIDGGMTI